MSHDRPQTVEQRLTMLEAELEQAKERVRAFEDWRKQLKRASIIGAGGVAALLFVLLQIVPASGNGPTIFKGPVYFENAAGRKLVSINDPNAPIPRPGGTVDVFNVSGAWVGRLGASELGAGAVETTTPDQRMIAQMGTTPTGPVLQFVDQNKKIAELAEGTNKYGMGLRIWNDAGNEVASLETNTHQRGLLELSDESANIRVEAGTNEDGDAVVTVGGRQGKCVPIEPLACELLSK